MITVPTVLILGAGASMPFKFPSGKDLLWDIFHMLDPKSKQCIELESLGFVTSDIQSFRNILIRSGKSSVDAFLEHRAEFIDIGKIAIAQALLPKERTNELFDQRKETWYEYFYNKLNAPFRKFNENQIAIITFNYDRSFEHYLITALKNTYRKNETECSGILNSIPIIHIYGKLGYLPWESIDGVKYDSDANPEDLKKAAENIRIISEDIDIDKEEDFEKILDNLHWGQNIYFIGFGYNETNLDRLRIQTIIKQLIYREDTSINIQGSAFGKFDQEMIDIKEYFKSKINLHPTDIDAYKFIRNVPLK